MHPDMSFDIARFHIEELHDQAARARLVMGRRRVRPVSRGSRSWTGLGFGKLRSNTAQ